ncbi:hypothetical protein [Deinococcus depolymerans]|uniref:Lipoprotein n=1 Tax=Deinococcus depolymerans TaxID=392408 RepID=A0ABN1BR27_9DEIO
MCVPLPAAPLPTGRRSHALLTAALCAALLSGCRPGPQGANAEDLVGRVLFTAAGSFDAQSGQKARIPGGLRRAVWDQEPKMPLDARRVTIQYDSDARPMTWMLDIEAPAFTARDVAGPDARPVPTAQGGALRPAASSRLRDALVITRPGGLKILTRSYATQVEPALLGAFQPVR